MYNSYMQSAATTYEETDDRKCVYTYEDKYTFARILSANSLVFDSHFESGNLLSAFRLATDDGGGGSTNSEKIVYDLYINNDVTAQGHFQWYYFSVSNTRAGQDVSQ